MKKYRIALFIILFSSVMFGIGLIGILINNFLINGDYWGVLPFALIFEMITLFLFYRAVIWIINNKGFE